MKIRHIFRCIPLHVKRFTKDLIRCHSIKNSLIFSREGWTYPSDETNPNIRICLDCDLKSAKKFCECCLKEWNNLPFAIMCSNPYSHHLDLVGKMMANKEVAS